MAATEFTVGQWQEDRRQGPGRYRSQGGGGGVMRRGRPEVGGGKAWDVHILHCR